MGDREQRVREENAEAAALWRRRMQRLLWIWVAAGAALLSIHLIREHQRFLSDVLAPLRVIVVALAAAASWHSLRRRRDRRRGARREGDRRAPR